MNKEAALDMYMHQLRELDEQELTLFAYERKAQQIAEEAICDIQSMMNRYDDHDIFVFVKQDINNLETEFLDDMADQKRQLNRQREALEEDYHQLIFEIEQGR